MLSRPTAGMCPLKIGQKYHTFYYYFLYILRVILVKISKLRKMDISPFAPELFNYTLKNTVKLCTHLAEITVKFTEHCKIITESCC